MLTPLTCPKQIHLKIESWLKLKLESKFKLKYDLQTRNPTFHCNNHGLKGSLTPNLLRISINVDLTVLSLIFKAVLDVYELLIPRVIKWSTLLFAPSSSGWLMRLHQFCPTSGGIYCRIVNELKRMRIEKLAGFSILEQISFSPCV